MSCASRLTGVVRRPWRSVTPPRWLAGESTDWRSRWSWHGHSGPCGIDGGSSCWGQGSR
jgi:hypothetical protein